MGLSREAEEEQLAAVIRVAQDNLTRTERYISQLTDELDDLREVYGTKDKEALALLFNTQSQLSENKRDLLRCQRARKKPYFGRIDFKDQKQPAQESYYIGRVGISQSGEPPLVIDWRAPLASVYYENTIGPCQYTVQKEGICEIDLKRKRTYEIEEDRLKDFYDSDVVANDELLTQYLAKNKRAVLGEIIATIQKEQNEIIRQSPKTNIIVQGVAGSGKTTVAMHRISYILYNYEEQFRPQDFYIIGSNRILLNYITGVLPDLDVYGVSQMTMEELFTRLMYEDWDPAVYRICPADRKDACIKGGSEWFQDLADFCSRYEQASIPREEVRVCKDGVLLLESSEIEEYLANNCQDSMQSRIGMLNEILLSRLENELAGKYVSYTAAEKKELRRRFRQHFGKDVWKGSVFEVYRQFLQEQEQKGKKVFSAEKEFDVYDLAALAYLYKRIKETDGVREASHIIIDEAQDFGMMAYEALAYCLRGCTYTIMGDVSQNIHFGCGLNDWSGLQKLILKGTYDRFGLLKKSYRNTVEISRFATEILRHGSFPIYPAQPVIRHGKEVSITACSSESDMIQKMAEIIRGWKKEGRETFAVICRDAAQTAEIGSRLKARLSDADKSSDRVFGVTAGGFGESCGGVADSFGASSGDAADSFGAPPEGVADSFGVLPGDAADSFGVSLEDMAGSFREHFGDAVRNSGEQFRDTGNRMSVQILAEAGSLETAEFGSGIMVLPVEYTKGLEFDAVLLCDPSKERYPAQDECVKLLYVAATRALHELAAVHLGNLTDLIASPVSKEKRMKSLETEVRKEAKRYEKEKVTAKEQERRKALQGEIERKARSCLGPRPVAVHPAKAEQKTLQPKTVTAPAAEKRQNPQLPYHLQKQAKEMDVSKLPGREKKEGAAVINPSPYPFGQCPDNSRLRPKGHGHIDNSVRITRKTKKYAEFISNYGTLRLTPVTDEVIRIQFRKSGTAEFAASYWDREPQGTGFWKAKEGKNLAEISTGKFFVRIEKKTGALQFYQKSGRLLLAEKAALPRQAEADGIAQNWVYFDWQKSENLFVKGILPDGLESMNRKARYISFGGKKMRMPLLVSGYGYGIGVAAQRTAVCCMIPMYGQYVYTEGSGQIDYYFLYGGSREAVLELYGKIAGQGR